MNTTRQSLASLEPRTRLHQPAHARGARGLRVLLYSWIFAPSVGGMETVAARLAQGLVEAGNRVVVVTDTPTEPGYDDRQHPYPVLRHPSLGLLLRLVTGADIVHLSGFDLRLFVLTRLLRRPTVWSHHDYGPTYCNRPGESERLGPCGPLHQGRACPLRRPGEGWTPVERVKRYLKQWVHLACARFVQANVVALPGHVSILPAPRATVIPYGVEQVRLPARRRARPTVSYVSRQAPGKGGDVLIRAIARLPRGSVDLVMASDGSERAAWQRLAADLEVAAEFPGFIDDDARRALYLESDIVVVPTIFAEYFGVVAIEAMACGAYVIASANGGLGEIVRTLGGETFPPGDDEALARIIAARLQDRESLRLEAQRLRELIDADYLQTAIVKRHLELYRSLLSSEPAASGGASAEMVGSGSRKGRS